MGETLAEKLKGELDVVLVRKIGAPGNPEYAIGAVDENGWAYMTESPGRLEPIAAYIEKEKARQQAICQERRRYTPAGQPAAPAGRTVIVIDDGLATGATMIAALRCIRAQQPARLVCAVPVGHPESVRLAEPFADAISCVLIPPDFRAVGQFYHDFSPVDEQEVEKILMRRKTAVNKTGGKGRF